MAGISEKAEVELELLTDIDMLLMVEKDIRGGICLAIHLHTKANNEHMKNYDPSKESRCLMYWDENNENNALTIDRQCIKSCL